MDNLKKAWVTPEATLEEFTPNEYVSSCWGVKCDKASDSFLNPHKTSYCGSLNNQAIYDYDNDGVADAMYEVARQKPLECTLYTDGKYNVEKNISEVKIGDTIYWTNTYAAITYQHYGTVVATNPEHPNRS